MRQKGYDKFVSSISRAGATGRARNPVAEVLSSISVRHNRRHVPSGVYFNKTEGNGNNGSKLSKEERTECKGARTEGERPEYLPRKRTWKPL